MTTLKFQDPPKGHPGGKTKYFTPDIVAALQARPGEWALVYPAVSKLEATAARSAGKRRGLEVTTRGTAVQDVYARWVQA